MGPRISKANPHLVAFSNDIFNGFMKIGEGERGYSRSVLTRFSRRVGGELLRRIIGEKVVKLLKKNEAEMVDAVLDVSFIKA
jgi:hypothetical protein